LQTRLYAFAHDSMMGRMRGREGNMKGTQYIANELQRLGVEPGGDNGTYFQGMPFELRSFSESSTLTADGTALLWLQDFVAIPGAVAPKPLTGAQVVFGGVQGDPNMISPARAAGKLVVFLPGQGGGRGG